MTPDIFQSFIMGGFECSTHRNRQGKRVDVIAATQHDIYADKDYQNLLNLGMKTARDGVRWHLVEKTPFQYDWSSVAAQIDAAQQAGVQVIWDLFHYGYPDDLDLLGTEFIDRFAAFAEKFTELLISKGIKKPLICLLNEISFFSWAAGNVGIFYPFTPDSADQIKYQLVRASIAAAQKIKAAADEAILIQTDPAIRVMPRSPADIESAGNYHNSQFHAIDLLIGNTEPEIGGDESYLDIIGVNYYSDNQWRHPGGRRIFRGQKDYKPFSEILKEFYARYQKPLFIAETGIEDEKRAEWFKYICEEVRVALLNGIPIYGICLYPIVNHPGWDDERHCYNGLWDYPDSFGNREIYEPLADEIRRQAALFEKTSSICKDLRITKN